MSNVNSKKFQKYLNKNSPKTGFRLHSKFKWELPNQQAKDNWEIKLSQAEGGSREIRGSSVDVCFKLREVRFEVREVRVEVCEV